MLTMSRRTGNIVAGILALALTGFLVIRTSSAVFTATTDNAGNTVAAGTLVLTDDDAGTALITMANVAPGATQSDCLTVTYDGSLDPLPVQIYSTSVFVTDNSQHPNQPGDAANQPNTNPDFGIGTNMEQVVNILIEEGSGCATTFAPNGVTFGALSASGAPVTLEAFHAATSAGFGSGYVSATSWDPAADGETRDYRVTLELDPATTNAYQGVSLSGIAVTWETQSQ